MPYTDYPFVELGDTPGELAPIRECTLISYDGDKYCKIKIEGVVLGVKRGYVYDKPRRLPISTEWALKVNPWGLPLALENEDIDALDEVYIARNIGQYFNEEVLVLAKDLEGEVIGGITEGAGEELSIAVDIDWEGQGLGTAMIKALLKAGGGGYMVAGTNEGLSFLMSLPTKLGYQPEELDVPCWEAFEKV